MSTEKEIAARTVIALMGAGVIKRSLHSLEMIEMRLGVTRNDLHHAATNRPGWRPSGVSTAAGPPRSNQPSAMRVDPSPDGRCANPECKKMRGATRTVYCGNECRESHRGEIRRKIASRRARASDFSGSENPKIPLDGRTKTCGGCYKTKPVIEFRLTRNGLNRNGEQRYKLKHLCLECEANYQRSRYVSLKLEKDLNRIGVALVATKSEVGLTCTKCDKPIRYGDMIEGHAEFSHWECSHPDEEEEESNQ